MGEVTYAQVRSNLTARLASGEFHTVERKHAPGRQFTTARTIEAEREILRRLHDGRNQVQPVATRAEAIQIADRHPHLNRAQKSVVEDVLSSPDRIQGVQGWAGSGKTTVLENLRSAVEAQGYEVQGFAPTSRAARQLREAGVESGTLQGFLARTAPSSSAPERKHFYFVDESSLASTNQMRDFLARLGPADRALLIGDTRQHQSVEAGRPFEQLQEAGMRTAKLDEIIRQKDPTLKTAVGLLATGQIVPALKLLRQQGRVTEIPDREERIRTIARTYAESPANTLIVSPDNASRRELNVAVRQELKATGIVAAEDHRFRVLVQRQDMTGADRAWANYYDVGDVVRYARGSKNMGIEAGSYGNVVGINPSANLLSVEMQSGETATYDPRRLTGVSVYREVSHDFSVGDRIQFTAPDRRLGVANHDLAAIESITPDGRIAARLDNDRLIELNTAEHRHFDHGYAVTSHSSQGITAERALVNMDTNVHSELLNSRFAYVSISRASHDTQIYTNNAASLAEYVSHDVNKASAIGSNRLMNPAVGETVEPASTKEVLQIGQVLSV
jgi:ATP-dependent exoDNAse (exonuclease V) alpha subunit